jgi:hypothetical protein
MVQPAHGHIAIVPQRFLKALSTVAGYLDAQVSRPRNNAQINSAREGGGDSVRKPCAEEVEGGRERFVVSEVQYSAETVQGLPVSAPPQALFVLDLSGPLVSAWCRPADAIKSNTCVVHSSDQAQFERQTRRKARGLASPHPCA